MLIHRLLQILADFPHPVVTGWALQVGLCDSTLLIPHELRNGVAGGCLRAPGIPGSRPPSRGAEDQAFRERVGTQAVGAIEADVGALASGVQAGQWGGAADVGV